MRTTTTIMLGLAAVLVSISGWAQEQQSEQGFSVQNFQASPGHGAFLTVEGADLPEGLGFRLGGLANYQYKPLVIRECETPASDGASCDKWADDETALVKHHLTLEVLTALSLFQVIEAGLAIPIVLYQTGDDVASATGGTAVAGPAGTVGLDDLRLHIKWDLMHTFGYEGDTIGLALIPVVSFPVGKHVQSDSFMGDSFITFHPKLAFGVNAGRVRWGINAGYILREEKEYYYASVGSRLSYGTALEVGFTDHVGGLVEVFGNNGFTSDITESPLEGDAALRFYTDSGLTITVGAGAGIIDGVGTPRVRAFAGLVWAPANNDKDGDGILDEDDSCPEDPEDKDDFEDVEGCPDPDNDQDGILDVDDECPLDPEDVDEFEDANGCPDPDNDQDGILDVDDECPNEAEDMDGDDDEDGCPEEQQDRDGDGLFDKDDQCPDDPEDKDGFEDENGCPDPDNDKDEILDVDDKCPNEPEVVNGVEDEDGCPDEALVVVKDDKIEIMEKVHFATNKAKIKGKKSFEILDAVIRILEQNPSIELRVEGHTDSRGKAAYNRKLSRKRAQAVVKYLVKKGLDEARFTAVGHGPDKPIDTNETREGRANNRRVEFHITSR